MKIIRTELFLRRTKKLFSEADMKRLESVISISPLQGDVIPGTQGLRKLRFATPGSGKRGGARVIYYLRLSLDTAYLLTAYAKSDQEDLRSQEKKIVIAFAQRIEGGHYDH